MILCDDGEKYAYLLHEKGDKVKQLHYPNMFHGFASATRIKAAQIAVDDFLKSIKNTMSNILEISNLSINFATRDEF